MIFLKLQLRPTASAFSFTALVSCEMAIDVFSLKRTMTVYSRLDLPQCHCLACFGISRERERAEAAKSKSCGEMHVQAQAMAAGVAPRRMKWANGPQNRRDTGFNGTHAFGA